mmetsp:Transcript_16360/g.41623  ORF Transcript_16360/g.41623 Transcript_16360/m.41623 type:complete len:240 (-) Transcript_16360:153-872(-)
MDPRQRDELHLCAGGVVQVWLDQCFDHEQHGQTKPQSPSAYFTRAHQTHHVHRRGVKAPQEHDPIDKPSAEHALTVERCLELVINSIAHVERDAFLLAVGANNSIAVSHISDDAIHLRPGICRTILERHRGVPITSAQGANQNVQWQSKNGEEPRDDEVYVTYWNQGVIDQCNCAGAFHEQLEINRCNVGNHAVHDAADGMFVEEMVDWSMEEFRQHQAQNLLRDAECEIHTEQPTHWP